MALEITDLTDLDANAVSTVLATLTQLIQEQHPEIDVRRGVFHDLVLYFNAALNTAVQENINRILQSRSLRQILQNPALADDELVDQVLSNFNVTRDAGSPATGVATFILATPLRTLFQAANGFSANEVNFTLPSDFVAVPNAEDVIDSTNRLIRAVGDGTYAITLPLVADSIGVAGNIRRGTEITADFSPNNVIRIYAAADFIGGREPLANEDYVQKLSIGLTGKAIGSRKSYEALIKNQPAFQNTLHVSVLGCGDPEQHRDQHGILPISGGGKIDVYVQTAPAAQEIDHYVTATFLGDSPNGSRWQAILSKETAPGFYEIARVLSPAAAEASGAGAVVGTYPVLEDLRNVDLINATYTPDIQYVHEGAYTRYQNAVIRFEDTDTLSVNLVPGVSTATYVVTTKSMPLVSDIHDFVTDRDNRPRGTDILVKAAVPCFTRISFAVHIDVNDSISPDTIAAMKVAIVKEISELGFSGQLHASLIAGVVHQFLVGRQAVHEIDMFGRIRRPDGSTVYLRDNTLLKIPNDPTRLVTGRTTVFLTDIADIEITPVTAGFAN